MSFFSWFTRTSKTQAPSQPQALIPQQNAVRKDQRMARRELLYTVVRDAMMRAGVLAAGYKFKVLSLDQRGAQFLVMVDLAQEYGSDAARLSGIEDMVARSAKNRFDILVPAMYWRVNAQIGASAQPVAPVPRTAPLVPPAPPSPLPMPRFEPIEADEMAAFKQALASAAAVSSGPLLPPEEPPTGFEDTAVQPNQEGRSSSLGSTQYGELR